MAIRIAIIEDDDEAAKNLEKCLRNYEKERACPLLISRFPDAMKFLNDYKPVFDVVFMDINLPFLDGLEAAKQLRKYDSEVILIFVTDLAQYAIKGYEVNAFDYIVKPVVYGHLVSKLDKVVRLKKENDKEMKITIKYGDGYVFLGSSSIRYIEVVSHVLYYHTDMATYSSYGSLKEAEKTFANNSFSRCNHCYLVNLKYVTAMDKEFVYIGQDKLKISRPKKKDFINDFTRFLGSHS